MMTMMIIDDDDNDDGDDIDIKGAIYNEESETLFLSRMKKDSKSSPEIKRAGNDNNNNNTNNGEEGRVYCFNCGGEGHYGSQCRKKTLEELLDITRRKYGETVSVGSSPC